MRRVVAGADPGGVTEATGWAGGGRFSGFVLSPPLVTTDQWGIDTLSAEYTAEMLAEAVCAEMGFEYLPPDRRSEDWCHGIAGERAVIHAVGGSLGADRLRQLSHLAGPERNLLVCCAAHRGGDGLGNLTLRRLPQCLGTRAAASAVPAARAADRAPELEAAGDD